MRKTDVFSKENIIIKSNDDWLRLAPPKEGKKQWKPYHSASELADYFVYYLGEVPKEIDESLDEAGVTSECFDSFPEYETSFPSKFGEGGPRNHDLLMIGKDKDIVIGIEAKATESLDKYLGSFKTNTENRKKRYFGLCKAVLDEDMDNCKRVRYQLLSATMGTLLEAKKVGARKAQLIVLLFNSKIVSQKQLKKTKADIDYFKEKLKRQKIEGKEAYCIKSFSEIEFYISYIVVDVCSYQKKMENNSHE